MSEDRLPSITHYVWEEDGKTYSSWKIDTGKNILNCGDGGMKLLEQAFRDKGMELLKEFKEKYGDKFGKLE